MNAISIISLTFSGVMLVVSVVNFVITNIRQTKQNAAEGEHELASLREGILKANIKLDTVCNTTSDTRTDIKAMNTQLTDIDKRLTVAENNISDAFDEIKELRNSKADKEV